MDAVDDCKNRIWKNEATGKDEEGADEDPTESKTQTRTTLTTLKPPVLQLHSKIHFVNDVGSVSV